MTYYDPLTGQHRLSNLQTAPTMAGAGAQYAQSPTTMGGQTLGGAPASVYGVPRTVTHPSLAAAAAGQPYGQQQFIPQAAPQASSVYGTSPAAQYIAATHAASGLGGGQPGVPGMAPHPAGAAPFNPVAAAQYGMQGQQGMGAGTGVPIPPNVGTPGQAHSYPGTGGGQYGYNYQDNGDHLPHHDRRDRKKKSRTRRILEELLAGTTLAYLTEKIEHRHDHARRNDNERRSENRNETVSGGAPNDPNVATNAATQPPPKGAALGFLHPQGHFVPSALDYMIEHFVRGNKDRGLAPEGARTGYLHPGGHFVPMGMEGLIQEFKHTLLGEHERRGRHRGSSSSDRSDSEYSDYSSGTEGRHRRR